MNDTNPAPDHPALAPEGESSPVTLEHLHDELAAATAESRRAQRRLLETLKHFGGVLDALSATVSDTHRAVRTAPAASPTPPRPASDAAADWLLPVADLTDRLDRLATGFGNAPAATSSWWPPARRALDHWATAWRRQADAVAIIRTHATTILQRAGLRLIEADGLPFDPALMTAVASEESSAHPDHTVLEVVSAGWLHAASGQVVRPAQVRVSRRPLS